MTTERRLVMSIRDIKNVTLKCKVCGTETSLSLDELREIPRTCGGPGAHNWNGGTPAGNMVIVLRDALAKSMQGGFELYLEFPDVKP